MQTPVAKTKSPSPVIPGLALFLGVFLLFLPCVRNGFVSFDDGIYVLHNPGIQHGLGWETVKWAFTTNAAANWHPLTWLSHALDWQLFGDRPWGHHLVNVVLHAASALLLFIVLRKMTGAHWRSLFVAAIFGIHPLRVESVVWAAERKDVLSTLFWMLTLLAYTEWVQKSAAKKQGSRLFYILALVFFALGLMSKPMLVTLPFALLLLDYWPLGRMRGLAEMPRLILEKIPFFVLAAAACLATYYAQKHGGAINDEVLHLSLGARIGNACVAYLRYIGMLFLPVHLAVFYPLAYEGSQLAWMALLSAVVLLGLTAAVLVRMRKQPYLFTGWFWYLGTLLPVIGLVQVGTQALADRYTYVPTIGFTLALTWGVCDLTRGWRSRTVALPAAAAVALAGCALLTLRQIAWWKDTVALFTHTLEVTGPNPLAEDELGCALGENGKTDEAITHFRQALRNTNAPLIHLNLGLALLEKNDFAGAATEFQTVLAAMPEDARSRYSLGLAYQGLGAWREAAVQFQETIKLTPDDANAHAHFGNVLGRIGDMDAAIAQYQAALRLNPGLIDIRNSLGIAFCREKRWDDAVREFLEVL